MAQSGSPIDDYLALLPDETEESRFLRRSPGSSTPGRRTPSPSSATFATRPRGSRACRGCRSSRS